MGSSFRNSYAFRDVFTDGVRTKIQERKMTVRIAFNTQHEKGRECQEQTFFQYIENGLEFGSVIKNNQRECQ